MVLILIWVVMLTGCQSVQPIHNIQAGIDKFNDYSAFRYSFNVYKNGKINIVESISNNEYVFIEKEGVAVIEFEAIAFKKNNTYWHQGVVEINLNGADFKQQKIRYHFIIADNNLYLRLKSLEIPTIGKQQIISDYIKIANKEIVNLNLVDNIKEVVSTKKLFYDTSLAYFYDLDLKSDILNSVWLQNPYLNNNIVLKNFIKDSELPIQSAKIIQNKKNLNIQQISANLEGEQATISFMLNFSDFNIESDIVIPDIVEVNNLAKESLIFLNSFN